MKAAGIYNGAIWHDCNESKHKVGINFTPEATNLTEGEVTKPPNQCGLLSEDFPAVASVTVDNQLKDKAISLNINTAWATAFWQRCLEALTYRPKVLPNLQTLTRSLPFELKLWYECSNRVIHGGSDDSTLCLTARRSSFRTWPVWYFSLSGVLRHLLLHHPCRSGRIFKMGTISLLFSTKFRAFLSGFFH